MAEYPDPEKINAIIDAKSDAIEQIDQSVIHEAVGVAMALDQLWESLNFKVEPKTEQR